MLEGGDLSGGGDHTMLFTDDVWQNGMPTTCVILLTSVTPINSVLKKGKNISGKLLAFIYHTSAPAGSPAPPRSCSLSQIKLFVLQYLPLDFPLFFWI